MESDSLPRFLRTLSKVFSSKCNVTQEEMEKELEKEILMMVDEGNEMGALKEQTHRVINNVFAFADLAAGDVMTHRTDMVAVSENAAISEVVKTAIDTGFSRIPVYQESVDHIIGVICVKDLLCLIGADNEVVDKADIKTFQRDIIYLPKTLSCKEVSRRLSEKKMQMAVIIDEYGGTAGVVTMEDIIESIVGNIQDEYDNEEEDLIENPDGTFIIDGMADVSKILPKLGLELPDDDDFDEIRTMSGFIVNLLGHIPEPDETPEVLYEGVLFAGLVIEDMCITKIKATAATLSQEIKAQK